MFSIELRKYCRLARCLSLIVAVMLLGACCKHEESSGDITSDLTVDGLDVYNSLSCYSLPDSLCIRDDSTYQAIFKVTSASSSCAVVHPPAVNFAENSVLLYLKDDKRNERYQRQVSIDKDNKTVYYTISSSKCTCLDVCRSVSLNMVLVPKIPVDYKVVFQ